MNTGSAAAEPPGSVSYLKTRATANQEHQAISLAARGGHKHVLTAGHSLPNVAGMNGSLPFLISLLIVPGVAQAGHRRTADFSAAIARSGLYDVAIKDAAARHSVDPRLLWTVAYLESRFQPRLVSRKGARGMMQFMPATGRKYGLLTLRDFHDPLRSIEAAAMYLRDLTAMFNGRIELVLAGYNAGENAVITSGYKVPRYYETRSYVARGAAMLRLLLQRDLGSEPLQNQVYGASEVHAADFKSRRSPSPQHDLASARPARSIYFP
jgi:hypothetical protein